MDQLYHDTVMLSVSGQMHIEVKPVNYYDGWLVLRN